MQAETNAFAINRAAVPQKPALPELFGVSSLLAERIDSPYLWSPDLKSR